ncbi:MAG TPA: helix-turn-helix domain-containing protein [Clostridia bacterium]|nr:helix-turn-helix domain-containing protein [Clostridia bacterium]
MFCQKIFLSDNNAYLTAYAADAPGGAPRPAVLIFPGGAYLFLSEHEGEPVALAFAAMGFQAFVLHYSVGKHSRMPRPILEGFEALATLRENAAAWHIDPNRIAVCGFSAGGHLAAMMMTRWNDEAFTAPLKKPSALLRPNAGVLCYALLKLPTPARPSPTGIPAAQRETFLKKMLGERADLPQGFEEAVFAQNGELWLDNAAIVYLCTLGSLRPNAAELRAYSAAELVSKNTPPAFLWTTATDDIVPASDSLDFAQAMYRMGRGAELHMFGSGTHGLSLAQPVTGSEAPEPASSWFPMAAQWLLKTLNGPEAVLPVFAKPDGESPAGTPPQAVQSAPQTLPEAPGQYYETIYQDRASMFRHTPFALEQQLVKAVMQGDEKESLRLMGIIRSTGDKAVLASDPLRSAKNSIICSCTFLARAAIQSGVPPEEAFALSDAVIRHIETLKSREIVLEYETTLLLQFIRLVRQKQSREYTAPIRRALHYIDTHLDTHLNLSDIAAYANVHPNYLSRRFRQETGKTVSAYATERKIKESVYFVQRAEYSMAEIAMLYGFSSQSYFIANFKKIMGMPPGEYRALREMVE